MIKKIDERVKLFQGKVSGEVLSILLAFLVIDIFYKSFFTNFEFQSYISELYMLLGVTLYIIIRYLIAGNDLIQVKGSYIFGGIFITSILVTAIGGISSYSKYHSFYIQNNFSTFWFVLGIMFLSSFILTGIIFTLVYVINNRRQKQIDKKLDIEEND
ncbi:MULTISPECIES: DUF6773 family protein [Lactobacillaceae]|uniref:DUF6773 family protein n=1 Tax=Lactobacillaceae TaxID=33958 RepID=UPI000C1B6DFD|nr:MULTISPECIES: DUF6773 family protein [Lactobacillaceae]